MTFLHSYKNATISSINLWACLQLTTCLNLNQRVLLLLMHQNRQSQERISFYYADEETKYTLLTLWDTLSKIIKKFLKRVCRMYSQINEVFKSQPIQPIDSVLCGLYCFYIAHILFSSKVSVFIFMSDNDLMLFSEHIL